jgi:hypothetical protein
MNKFLVNALIFFAIIGIINCLLLILFKKLYINEYINDPQEFTSFLMSDSHGLALEDHPEKFGIFNFSAGSDSYIDMKRKLNYLISRQRVDTLLIQVEGQVLSAFREGSNNAERSVYYASINDFDSRLNYLKEAVIKYYVVLLNPKSQSVFRYYIRSQIRSLFRSDDRSEAKDWESLPESEKYEITQERVEQFYSYGLSETMIQSFEDIVNICEEYGIHLIGIKFPLPDLYIEAVNEPENAEVYRNHQRADSIFSSYGLEILDFSNQFKGMSHLYKDEDHLNPIGGELLADTLKARLFNNSF